MEGPEVLKEARAMLAFEAFFSLSFVHLMATPMATEEVGVAFSF